MYSVVPNSAVLYNSSLLPKKGGKPMRLMQLMKEEAGIRDFYQTGSHLLLGFSAPSEGAALFSAVLFSAVMLSAINIKCITVQCRTI